MRNKILIIFLAALVIFSAFFIAGCGLEQPKFKISDLDLDKDESDYSTAYYGTGTVTTRAKGTYAVIMRCEKKYGSSDSVIEDGEFVTVLVVDGEGLFTTYDYIKKEDNEKYKKPKYDFEVVAYTEYIPVG